MTSSRQLMSADDIRRAISRIAHEILERHRGTEGLVLAGIQTRGVPLAQRIVDRIAQFEGATVPSGSLDVGLYRDDAAYRSRPRVRPSTFDIDLNGARIVLVDDVLYTGRTIRAALDALMDFGRPSRVQLAVMVDRGHRELPIRADYVGYNIPTSPDDIVRVRLVETDGIDEVTLVPGEEEA